MAKNDWFKDIIAADKQATGYTYRRPDPTMAAAYGSYQKTAPSMANARPAVGNVPGVSAVPSPMDLAGTSPSGFFKPDAGNTGERARFERMRDDLPTETDAPTPPGGGGGGGGVSDIFGPLFQALDQQRANANSRYTSNVGQIQNIYGQIVGARSADIGSIEKAYARLQAAAASRGEATISGMQDREADRVSGNQAVLQSMGVGDIGVAGNDVAAQSSATAQDVAALNQANWSGMLDSMGATAQEVARADITGFGYRQGEDIAALQGAKEDYLQNVANQEFELKFQQQQAKLQAQQAAAAQAAAQEAAAQEAANKQQEDQYDEILKYSGPLTAGLTALQTNGAITAAQAAQTTDAYDSFMRNIFSQQPLQGIAWNAAQAAAAFRTSSSAEGLDPWQKELVEQQIKTTF